MMSMRIERKASSLCPGATLLRGSLSLGHAHDFSRSKSLATSPYPRHEIAESADAKQALTRDFSQVPARGPSTEYAQQPLLESAVARNSGREGNHLAISSSGDPTITVKYAPEASDKSTKIVFIQVVQTSLDGTAVKPGTANASWSHLDADTTADNYAVDHLAGEVDPYYNGDDAGKDSGTQGNATSKPPVTADMTDAPSLTDAGFPAGKKTFKAQFRTLAFSAAGADKGTFYAYARWSFSKEKGKAGAITHEGTSTTTALPQTRAAIDLWCTNHGFALPK
jgi:hypothetical protein